MKSFFEKSEAKHGRLIFFFLLKYNLSFNELFDIDWCELDKIYDKYKTRFNEVIENSYLISIKANRLNILPNIINNKNLILNIWYYRGEDLPKKMSIKGVIFEFSYDKPKISLTNKMEIFEYNKSSSPRRGPLSLKELYKP